MLWSLRWDAALTSKSAWPDCLQVADALRAAGIELFMEPETKWYRVGDHEAGVQQFLVTDSDGYLVRLQSSLGRRGIAR